MISPMGCTGWRPPAASVELIWDTCLMMDQDPQGNATALTLPHWLSSPKTQPPPSPRPRAELPAAQWMMGRQSSERKNQEPQQTDERACVGSHMYRIVMGSVCVIHSVKIEEVVILRKEWKHSGLRHRPGKYCLMYNLSQEKVHASKMPFCSYSQSCKTHRVSWLP